MGFFIYVISLLLGCATGAVLGFSICNQTDFPSCIIYSACIIIMCIIITTLFYLRQSLIYKNLNALYKVNKNNYVKKSRNVITHTFDKVLKIKTVILLAEFFVDENDLVSAKKALDMYKPTFSIYTIIKNPFIRTKYKLSYCLKQISLCTSLGNLAYAQNIFKNCDRLLFRYSKKSKYNKAIFKILSEYEYKKENYKVAYNYIQKAIDNSENLIEKDNLKIFLADILYKMDKYQESELILEQVIQNNSSEKNVTEATNLLLQKNI